jgi:Kdo2-lipid IVA lauroyltransferase/acyltransferase
MFEWLIRFGILLLRALCHLPYPVLRGLSAALASVLYALASPRRKVTLINLRLCFPNWDEARRTKVAKQHFRAFTQTFLDRFIFWYGSPTKIQSLTQVEGAEHLRAALGKPLLIFAPHFVGMDAGGLRVQMETQVFGMYARQRSAALTDAMIQGRQRFNNTEMLLRTGGLRPALKRIKQNIPFYFCPDMDLGPNDAVFVDFFGVPAATVTTMHRLARITGAQILPCITRLTDTGYVVQFEPVWENFPSSDEAADTRRMNAFIEQAVLKHPEQYLWSHRRFKTRPPGAPPVYPNKR